MEHKTDQDYISLTLKGDTNAFSFLVEKYKDYVFHLTLKLLKNKEEAEEVAQDVFLKAYRYLPTFKGESKFSTWLYKIAYNTSLDAIKKKSNAIRNVTIDELTVNQISSVETALDGIEKEERAVIMNDCMQELEEEERGILFFFYYKESSLKEIVEVTSMSKANVKVKLHRARKKLLHIVKQRVEPELIRHYGRK